MRFHLRHQKSLKQCIIFCISSRYYLTLAQEFESNRERCVFVSTLQNHAKIRIDINGEVHSSHVQNKKGSPGHFKKNEYYSVEPIKEEESARFTQSTKFKQSSMVYPRSNWSKSNPTTIIWKIIKFAIYTGPTLQRTNLFFS